MPRGVGPGPGEPADGLSNYLVLWSYFFWGVEVRYLSELGCLFCLDILTNAVRHRQPPLCGEFFFPTFISQIPPLRVNLNSACEKAARGPVWLSQGPPDT